MLDEWLLASLKEDSSCQMGNTVLGGQLDTALLWWNLRSWGTLYIHN